jgi:hypothetical protein
VFAIAIYGGYFGAAAGVMVLALMLVATGESLARSNAFKNVVLGVANATAAVAFALLGDVHWDAAAPLALGLFAGGRLGPIVVRPLRRDRAAHADRPRPASRWPSSWRLTRTAEGVRSDGHDRTPFRAYRSPCSDAVERARRARQRRRRGAARSVSRGQRRDVGVLLAAGLRVLRAADPARPSASSRGRGAGRVRRRQHGPDLIRAVRARPELAGVPRRRVRRPRLAHELRDALDAGPTTSCASRSSRTS